MAKFIKFDHLLLNSDHVLSFEKSIGDEEATGKFFIFANLANELPDDEVSCCYLRWIFTDKQEWITEWDWLFNSLLEGN